MTPNQAREHADSIIAELAAGTDPEAAHANQDRFVADVLHAIAASNPDPWVRQMVVQGLRVADAPGTRWYA